MNKCFNSNASSLYQIHQLLSCLEFSMHTLQLIRQILCLKQGIKTKELQIKFLKNIGNIILE